MLPVLWMIFATTMVLYWIFKKELSLLGMTRIVSVHAVVTP